MPPALACAHAALDRAVDRCCRPQPFPSELACLEFLFGLYQQLSAPELGAAPKARPDARHPRRVAPCPAIRFRLPPPGAAAGRAVAPPLLAGAGRWCAPGTAANRSGTVFRTPCPARRG
ncbi:type IIL restriction-modification enzyme MmeI [Hymenobacter sp. BT523]|uniref:type IIL restriction-modification enzyme MmeI n=1 Tax=Hymenobacter sp. BT523 TaxID=2795725 RepID=UPI00293D5E0C|nr:type IIL restriction-modification enzyme MmeI [Hymenobacter sp. BT523]